jgi:hypothetical protein
MQLLADAPDREDEAHVLSQEDLADAEAILRNQRTSLDRRYIRRSLLDLVGESDERVRAPDEIEADVDR